VNIWPGYKQESGCLVHFAHLANALLKDEERARGCLAVSKTKKRRKRLYHLTRSPDESFINDYNPALLLTNQANVDVPSAMSVHACLIT